MRLSDASWNALTNLRDNKLRSALTMLGMMFGVGAVIAMLSIGAGAEKQAIDTIDKMGVRNIIISSIEMKTEELEEVREKSLGLSRRDIWAIDEAIDGISVVAPLRHIDAYQVLSSSGKSEADVRGVSKEHSSLVGIHLFEGRFIDAHDEDTHSQVAVVGWDVRRDLFGSDPAVGQDLKINGLWFEVVGVIGPDPATTTTVEGVAVRSTASEIYVPFTTAVRKFDHPPLQAPLDEIIVQVDEEASPSSRAKLIAALLDRLHSGVSDYEIVVPETLLRQSQQTQRLFNIVMGCIAGIALLVGGIGIMNIMLASVLEQTREIGIRRAVGARRRDIRFQFLVASFALSLIGGLCGIGLGLAIAEVVATYADWPTIVTPASIVVSTGVSMAVGLVSGLYPAMRAAALDPITALHHE